jgi:hypothetical protein
MSLLQNSNAISTGGGYNLESSLRLRESASAYLNRTPSSTGNQKTFTISVWLKRGKLGGSQDQIISAYTDNNNRDSFGFGSEYLEVFNVVGGGVATQLTTTDFFRDPSSWYHVIFSVDTTQATESNRFKIYVNNRQVTSFSTANYPSQNENFTINKNVAHYIGCYGYSTLGGFYDGYMTEFNLVDGQALTPSDFGETDTTTGVWKPKEYTGTYGTNGFYLPMKETQQATGFNTVLYTGTGATQSISNVGFSPDLVWIKNRNQTGSAHILQDTIRGAGKSLFSHLTNAESGNSGDLISSFDADGFTVNTNYLGGTDNSTNKSGDGNVAWCWDAGNDNTTGSELITNGTFDTDTSSWTAVDGTLSASGQKLTVTRTGATFGAAYQAIATTSGKMYAVKFDTEYVAGNGNFVLVGTSPSNADLGTFGPYTTNSINNVVTFIATGSTTYIRLLADTLIGVTAIWDNISVKEVTQDGTIPSYYKANPATGFSIVTYTVPSGGASFTVGHGLGVAPSMIITKNRGGTSPWPTWFTGFNKDEYVNLNTTAAKASQTDYWGSAVPTSTVFGNKEGVTWNAGVNVVAYCFSEVAGYSKFGSYTGTSGDITINCGFRPAFVMVKNTSSTGNWEIHDNTRHPSVATDTGYSARLRANDSSAEAPFNDSPINFTDTGFVLDSSVTGNSYVDYDNNGNTYIYMAFADTRDAQFNFDASGNKNNWTANNINSNASSESTYDIMNDVATLTDEDTANFATLNPLSKGANSTLSNANLNWAAAQMAGGNHQSISSIAMSSGKWYCEFTPLGSEPQGCIFGLVSNVNTTGVYPGFTSSSYGYAGFSGNKYNNASASAYGATFALGDVIGIAFDADVGTLTFYKNGVSQGTAFSSIPAGSYYFGVGNNSSLAVLQAAFNAGQRPFKYTPPTGFKKLNTYNLPDSTIKDGSQYFDVVTYTGNATLGKVINTSIDFSTNGLAWFKARSNSAVISDWNNHFIVDSLRTFSGTPYFQILNSNSTIAESADGNILRDATSTSFQKGSGTTNENNIPYVGWLWQAGATSSSNTDGTITSTVSANTDSGFSVVTYTGAGTSAGTVGHGLGVAPKVVIAKSRDGARNWAVYHSSLGINYLIELNTTSAQINIPNYWGSVSPTSEVFGVYTANNVGNNNYLNEDMVAYCFAEVEGFSKIGSYTGNGSADGTFVYFGFRPKYIMIKRTDSTGDWIVLDAARYLNNPNGTWLYPNLSNAEGVLNDIGDILSNGYKNRNTQSVVNASGGTYIYMAFAENPFKQSLAR